MNKKILLILLIFTLISCENDDSSNIKAECIPDSSNELAGCWIYEKCFPSVDSPGTSTKVGTALSSDGIVLADLFHFYESSDCLSNRNGGGEVTHNGGTTKYTTNGSFLNANGLNVTEFHFINNSGITKKTYYYFNNGQLCFPNNTFMGNYNANGWLMIDDSIEYNELNEQIDLVNCFSRIYN